MTGRALWAARLLASASATLVVAGFLLPWFEGTAEFAARDFSGFDLARLVRNLEIASSTGEAGRFRIAALVMYLVPALAVNAGVFAWVPMRPPAGALASAAAASYVAVVLGALAILASVGDTDMARVLGGAAAGFWVTGVGAIALGVAAALQSRS